MPAEAPSRLETIVDTGANVGYACLWLLSECPQARITAFEPVPAHVAQIEAHLRLNGLRDRVELVPAAASVKDGTAHFEDKGPESGPAEDGSAERIVVSLVDWYARLPEGPIDLVKMDIEGGECDLLDDARFAELAARTRMIVLEWHEPTNGRGGRDWCAERLAQAGFSVSDGAQQYGVAGLLWGVRASVQAPNEFSTSS
jgi:FkbM family methyltransferase